MLTFFFYIFVQVANIFKGTYYFFVIFFGIMCNFVNICESSTVAPLNKDISPGTTNSYPNLLKIVDYL